MNYLKFPIVTWKDAQDNFTVATVSGAKATAFGKDPKKCINQIKSYLNWTFGQNPYEVTPEFSVPQLDYYSVPIRTGYEVDEESYPAEERLSVKIPVVWGMRDDDLVVCVLPTLGQTFHCRNEAAIPKLINGQAQRLLNGREPRELSRFLCPEEITVESLNVRLEFKEANSGQAKYPILEAVATPFGTRTHKSSFPQAWQRDDLVRELLQKLESPRGNLLILGNSGVGKSTLLVNAIRKLEKTESKVDDEDEAPDTKASERYWFTTADRLISGMKYLGEWEERVEEVIGELSSIQGTLCFENLEQLVRLGGNDPAESIAAFLIPYLQNNELRLVVETNARELDACKRLLPGFESLFEVFDVEDFSQEKARQVLLSMAAQFRQNLKLKYDDSTADLTYRLFKRYFPYETFPGKCVKFWKELFVEHRSQSDALKLDKKSPPSDNDRRLDATFDIGTDHVVSKFIKQTGLPEALIRDEFVITAEEVFGHLRSKIIGQADACRTVTNIVTTLKSGLNDPARPIGVRLFCGPTGVGKTEMAKTLAEYMFGSGVSNNESKNNERLIRLDMSEYSGFGAAEKLLMQSNGEPSKMIQQIREQPFAVLLFDEIEKAASEVFDVMMGLFDEGRLTDRWGRTTDFRSTIIIMTSNLGVKKSQPIGFENDESDSYEKEVRQFFRPEFFNRFDGVVSFHSLSQESIRSITNLELRKVEKRSGLQSRDLRLSWSEGVVDFLVKSGFDKRLGARPLQRTIESWVVAPIARVLAEEPGRRSAAIQLSVENRRLIVKWD